MKLTARAVETAKPAAVRREIPDALMPSLYLVVQPSGTKSWAVRYRHNGTTRKFTLGSHPAIDLKAARALAGKALRAAAEGRDPGQEKAQARAARADTIDRAVAQFIERHCKRKNRPRTAQETERLLRLHVMPRWRGRAVSSITRRDVLDVLDRVVDAGAPIAANRVIATSPCAGVKPPTDERSRDRVLDDKELRAVWLAAEEIGWPFGAMVKVLILTGQRRDEVARMEWSEIDFGDKLWTLPRERVKNDEKHEVPLSDTAVAVLKSVPRIAGSRYVFTTNGEAPSSGYSKGKRRLDALLSGMPPWRLHDLRRTTASGMARLGINLPVIEKVLNHASGSFAGIVGVYQKHGFSQEKRRALEAWAAFVAGLAGDKGP
jgi:integrase